MTSRAENRIEQTRTIQATGRRHLAEVGPAALSLRAIARDVGLVSSAVYRYFPSRDDLLTALIIESYDELGEAVEAADQAIDPADLAGRFRALCHAIHGWARRNPHEYALVYTKMDRFCAHDRFLQTLCDAIKREAEDKMRAGRIDVEAVKRSAGR